MSGDARRHRCFATSCRAINAGDFEFISESSQTAIVREFVESLSSILTR